MLTFFYWTCDLWHFRAPIRYSFLISERMIYGPFQYYFPLSHSTVAWLLVLMEIVENLGKHYLWRNQLLGANIHIHTIWEGDQTFPFRAAVPWLPLDTESGQGGHFLRSIGLSLGLLASLGTLSPGAKSYSENPKAKHCWVGHSYGSIAGLGDETKVLRH